MSDNESKVADRPKRPHNPGALQSQAVLKVYTDAAVRLVQGRRGDKETGVQPIVGLKSYASAVGMMWRAAESDDPYADWFLLRLEQGIEQAQEALRKATRAIERRLNGVPPTVQVTLASSDGVEIPLTFRSPFGFMAAYLIADLDTFVRHVRTGMHVAIIGTEEGQIGIRQHEHRIRSALTVVTGWKQVGVTREDIRQQNQRARQGREVMGDLPPDVLEERTRSMFAPRIRRTEAVPTTESVAPEERTLRAV